jgi:hypothetical protein
MMDTYERNRKEGRIGRGRSEAVTQAEWLTRE